MVIRDRLAIIIWARIFIGKHNHVKNVQDKLNPMLLQIKDFERLFQKLFDDSLPSFWDNDGRLFSQEQYHNLLVHNRMDHSKLEDLTKGLTRKVIIRRLTNDFEIFDQFLITQISFPPMSYTSYVELEVLIKEMMDYNILNKEQWKVVEKFTNNKYRLHQSRKYVTIQRSRLFISSGIHVDLKKKCYLNKACNYFS